VRDRGRWKRKHRRCLTSTSCRGNPPMLPVLNLPASLLNLLIVLRPCLTAPAFATFCGLVAGLAGLVRRRTVVGRLLGAGLQPTWPAPAERRPAGHLRPDRRDRGMGHASGAHLLRQSRGQAPRDGGRLPVVRVVPHHPRHHRTGPRRAQQHRLRLRAGHHPDRRERPSPAHPVCHPVGPGAVLR
jgi:hypothetical protein